MASEAQLVDVDESLRTKEWNSEQFYTVLNKYSEQVNGNTYLAIDLITTF